MLPGAATGGICYRIRFYTRRRNRMLFFFARIGKPIAESLCRAVCNGGRGRITVPFASKHHYYPPPPQINYACARTNSTKPMCFRSAAAVNNETPCYLRYDTRNPPSPPLSPTLHLPRSYSCVRSQNTSSVSKDSRKRVASSPSPSPVARSRGCTRRIRPEVRCWRREKNNCTLR